MDYAENYERCCKERVSFLQRHFMEVLSRKGRALGQQNHKMWSLKYLIDTYFDQPEALRVMDCGAWDGWFLSYDTPVIRQRIALDFDPAFARQLLENGTDFILADMEKGTFPVASNALDLVAMTSTLEHLSCPEKIATEIRRVLRPGGIVFITVPDIMKYKFRFWDDITHKRPFNSSSLRFLFESHGNPRTLPLQPQSLYRRQSVPETTPSFHNEIPRQRLVVRRKETHGMSEHTIASRFAVLSRLGKTHGRYL